MADKPTPLEKEAIRVFGLEYTFSPFAAGSLKGNPCLDLDVETGILMSRQQAAMDFADRHFDAHTYEVTVDKDATIRVKKREQTECRRRWNGTRYVYEEIKAG